MIHTKLFISTNHNPYYNLALEEWALRNADTSTHDYLILYIDKPSVIVGRNQNIFEEVNLAYCREKNIEVARRISGGGTVFHDEGNLNWSFITSFDTKKVNAYDWAAKFIIELLATYDLKAYLTERNAIEVNGVKLSGQAQFTNRKNILSHGTLLVNSDLNLLQTAIEINEDYHIKSKAAKSVRSSTANLSTLIQQELTVEDVLSKIKYLHKLENIDWSHILVDEEKFKQKEWLYERSPKFTAIHLVKGESLTFEVYKAVIQNVTNEKGHLLKDSLFRNQTYEKLLKDLSN